MTNTQKALKIGVLVGSLRKDSYNRKLAHAAAKLASENLELEIIEIGNLPLYNSDLDGEDAPVAWREFREKVRQADGLLFLTPEYNRSISGALKNALDVGSRPYGQSAWSGKPGAVISSSMGALAAFGANHHLRQALVFLDVPAMAQPEAYIGNTGELFDEAGELINEGTRDFLKNYMAAFERWVRKNL